MELKYGQWAKKRPTLIFYVNLIFYFIFLNVFCLCAVHAFLPVKRLLDKVFNKHLSPEQFYALQSRFFFSRKRNVCCVAIITIPYWTFLFFCFLDWIVLMWNRCHRNRNSKARKSSERNILTRISSQEVERYAWCDSCGVGFETKWFPFLLSASSQVSCTCKT